MAPASAPTVFLRLRSLWQLVLRSGAAPKLAVALAVCAVVQLLLRLRRSKAALSWFEDSSLGEGLRQVSKRSRARGGTVDVGGEPRATERTPPPVLKSRVLRHRSFYDVYDVADQQSLGKGLNGDVLKATHRRSKREVAAKLLQTRPNTDGGVDDDLPDELALYLRLSHPNICRLLEAFVEKDGEVWMVMENCSGGELFDQVSSTSKSCQGGKLEPHICDTEERVADLIRQMAGALCYIHSMGVVHRDNKLENWVFASPTQERIKLIDFGLAVRVVSEGDSPADPASRSSSSRAAPKLQKLNKVCGTCYYVAPEVLRVTGEKLSAGNGYGAEVDIWALGVILYMLISGTAPFTGHNEAAILWEIALIRDTKSHLAESFRGRRWKNVSDQCKDLIACCLTRDPRRRLTAREVLDHPWLSPSQKLPEDEPVLVNQPLLGHLITAGYRMARNRFLAYLCGHLAQRMYLEPALWTAMRDDFQSLGTGIGKARGSLPTSELLALCLDEQQLDRERGAEEAEASDREEFLRSVIKALDLTGDGHLHFFEFFGAMMVAGRIRVEEHYVKDAFNAFDLDSDGAITASDLERTFGVEEPANLRPSLLKTFRHAGLHKTSMDAEALALPIKGSLAILNVLLEAVNEKSMYIPRLLPKRPHSVPGHLGGAPQPARRNLEQHVLDREKHKLAWKVERRAAFGVGQPRIPQVPSLHRGFHTSDPAPSHVFSLGRPFSRDRAPGSGRDTPATPGGGRCFGS